jgi:hypothetical protein
MKKIKYGLVVLVLLQMSVALATGGSEEATPDVETEACSGSSGGSRTGETTGEGGVPEETPDPTATGT